MNTLNEFMKQVFEFTKPILWLFKSLKKITWNYSLKLVSET